MSQDPSDSEYNALTYFSTFLAHKYVNLKGPYNKNIKEQVITKFFLKKEDRLFMKSQTQRHSLQKVLFKFNPLFVVLTLQIIYQ